MSASTENARHFLEYEQSFRLGALLTEASHPVTANLSTVTARNTSNGVRLLATVDNDLIPVAERILSGQEFQQLSAAMAAALVHHRRIIFTGCGATGRLAVLLEAAWRRFWSCAGLDRQTQEQLASRVVSIMAGGDYALIKSVEGFEDFADFGRFHLRQLDIQRGDVVIAVSEGGETPFVIGTVWEALAHGADTFFVYNNPTALLAQHVERSREVIESDAVVKVDLTTGPMAVRGSTRMQATTIELFVLGAALEIALVAAITQTPAFEPAISPPTCLSPCDYVGRFRQLLEQLAKPTSTAVLAALAEREQGTYERGGLVTYFADSFMLDVLTDTTERSPTFMVPPFRASDEHAAPHSWAFAQNPCLSSAAAWRDMLQRHPVGLDWTRQTYQQLNAPSAFQCTPPVLNRAAIHKFQIGNDSGLERLQIAGGTVGMIVGATECSQLHPTHPFYHALERYLSGFHGDRFTLSIGATPPVVSFGTSHHIDCDVAATPLRLFAHLAIKLALNTVSTATMARMGRLTGNCMAWVSPSNKKLIDRGTRLIAELTGVRYDEACHRLFRAIETVNAFKLKHPDQAPPSPVNLAISQSSTRNG